MVCSMSSRVLKGTVQITASNGRLLRKRNISPSRRHQLPRCRFMPSSGRNNAWGTTSTEPSASENQRPNQAALSVGCKRHWAHSWAPSVSLPSIISQGI
ncbi:hypothetical protein D3C76_1149270 [compost metagenome]